MNEFLRGEEKERKGNGSRDLLQGAVLGQALTRSDRSRIYGAAAVTSWSFPSYPPLREATRVTMMHKKMSPQMERVSQDLRFDRAQIPNRRSVDSPPPEEVVASTAADLN